jgi:hypothetical protein
MLIFIELEVVTYHKTVSRMEITLMSVLGLSILILKLYVILCSKIHGGSIKLSNGNPNVSVTSVKKRLDLKG